MLGNLGDDVVAALTIHLGDPFERKVIALRSTGRKNDLFRGGANEFGNLLASSFNGLLGLPAKGVITAGCIAKLGSEIRQHGLQHPGDPWGWWRDYPCKSAVLRPSGLQLGL